MTSDVYLPAGMSQLTTWLPSIGRWRHLQVGSGLLSVLSGAMQYCLQVAQPWQGSLPGRGSTLHVSRGLPSERQYFHYKM